MDSLHLTYHQVLEEIPYRVLVLMSKDKLRCASGEVYREMTEEEALAFTRSKIKKN